MQHLLWPFRWKIKFSFHSTMTNINICRTYSSHYAEKAIRGFLNICLSLSHTHKILTRTQIHKLHTHTRTPQTPHPSTRIMLIKALPHASKVPLFLQVLFLLSTHIESSTVPLHLSPSLSPSIPLFLSLSLSLTVC